MKFEVEIPDPRFKVGDFIVYPCGPDGEPKTPVVFGIHSILVRGAYVWQPTMSKPHIKAEVVAVESYYVMSCQQQIPSPRNGSEWLYPRLVMKLETEDVDVNAELVTWDAKMVPPADIAFYDEKWKTEKIKSP